MVLWDFNKNNPQGWTLPQKRTSRNWVLLFCITTILLALQNCLWYHKLIQIALKSDIICSMYYLFKYWITIYFCSLSIICRIIRIPNSSEAEKLNMQCSQLVILKKKKGIVNVSGKLLVDLPTQYKWLHISFHPFIAIDDSRRRRLPRSSFLVQARYGEENGHDVR